MILDHTLYGFDPLGPLYLVAALLLLWLGGGVLAYERFSRASRRFFVVTAIVASWLAPLGMAALAAEPTLTRAWLRIAFVTDPFTTPALFSLVTALAGVRRPRLQAAFWTVGAAFAGVSVAGPWLVDGLETLSRTYRVAGVGWLGGLYFLYLVGLVALALAELVRSQRRAPTPEERQQLRVLAIAGTIASLTLLDYWTPTHPFRVGWVTPICLTYGAVIAGVVALRWRVFSLVHSFGTDEVLRTMSDAVIVVDSAGRVRGGNRAAEQLLRRGWDEMRGEPVSTLLAEPAREGEAAGDGAEPTGDGWVPPLGEPLRNQELRLLPASGPPVAVRVSIEPLRSRGRAVGTVVVARDVRERMEAERALEAAELRFRSLVQNSPAVVYEFAPDGTVVDMNPAARRFLGLDMSEIVGRSFEQLVDPEDVEQAWENFRQVLQGQARPYELGLRIPGGRECRIRGVNTPVVEDGRVVTVLGIALDITEETRAKRELEVEKRYFAELFESSPEAVALVSEDGTILRINGEFTRLFGYTRDEVVGRDLDGLLVPEGEEEAGAAFSARALAGDVVRVEAERRHRDGRRIPVSLLARLLHVPGEPLQMCAIYRDITERREAEEQLKQREEELRHAQKLEAVGQLAGGVAHDFNNLLTVINGHASILLEELEPACTWREDVEEIERAAGRAAGLTQQLLAFSRRQMLRPQTVDLHRVVDELQRMLGRLIGEHIEVVTRLDAPESRVHADRGQIEQVLVNLVVNARDAMPGGGLLTLATDVVELGAASPEIDRWKVEPGRYVRLVVRDTGVGMDRHTMEQAFEPFFTTKERGKGTGLGLSTVFGIMKQSHGHVTLESAPGRGSAFSVYLPLSCANEEAPAETAAADAPAVSAAGRTVLVVEDEEAVRKLATRVLRRAGHTVLEACNGADALHLLEGHAAPLDLVVSDLLMPQMNGHQLAAVLQRRRPELPILFISGYDDRRLPGGEPPAEAELLLKPFTPIDLADRVATMLS